MKERNSFDVIIRRKIPYLTSFLFYLLTFFTIVFLVLGIVFLPTEHQSDEMKVAYFILVVPNIIKVALFISGSGFLVLLILYTIARRYNPAIITFQSETIKIIGQKINIEISINTISKVYCMDSKNLEGESRQKMTIYFELKSIKEIRVRLKDYSQVDQFMEGLMQYEDLNFKFYDFDVSPNIEDEE